MNTYMTDIMNSEMSAQLADLLRFRVECTGEGEAVGILDAGPQHANPMGTLHRGVLCDVADAAMGMAFASTLGHDDVAIVSTSIGVAGESPCSSPCGQSQLHRVRHHGSERETNRQGGVDMHCRTAR